MSAPNHGRLLKFFMPICVGSRDKLTGRAGLPDTQQPDPVEAHLGPVVNLVVGEMTQGCRSAQLEGRLRQPNARVDLVKRGITRAGHDVCPVTSTEAAESSWFHTSRTALGQGFQGAQLSR